MKCPKCQAELVSGNFYATYMVCPNCDALLIHSDPAGEEDTPEDLADKFVYHTEITDPKECFLGGYRYAQETLPFASIIEGLSIDELRIAYQEFRKSGSGTKRTNFEAFTAGYRLKPPTPQTARTYTEGEVKELRDAAEAFMDFIDCDLACDSQNEHRLRLINALKQNPKP